MGFTLWPIGDLFRTFWGLFCVFHNWQLLSSTWSSTVRKHFAKLFPYLSFPPSPHITLYCLFSPTYCQVCPTSCIDSIAVSLFLNRETAMLSPPFYLIFTILSPLNYPCLLTSQSQSLLADITIRDPIRLLPKIKRTLLAITGHPEHLEILWDIQYIHDPSGFQHLGYIDHVGYIGHLGYIGYVGHK